MAIDTAGTPLDKKETTDIQKIENKGVETPPQTSQVNSAPTSLGARIKNRFNQGVSGAVQYVKETPGKIGETIKREVTYEHAKQIGGTIIHNVGENMKSDVGYLGKQTIATIKTDRTIKPSERVPSLFHGEGSFAPDIFGQVKSVKISNKKKKTKVVIKHKTANIENVGVVGSVFGNSSTKQSSKVSVIRPRNINSIGVVSDPFSKMNTNKIQVKKLSDSGGFNFKPLTSGSMKTNPLTNMTKSSKQLNSNKSNNTGMFELTMFKKKRGGLF